jgi:hypothetical protein
LQIWRESFLLALDAVVLRGDLQDSGTVAEGGGIRDFASNPGSKDFLTGVDIAEPFGLLEAMGEEHDGRATENGEDAASDGWIFQFRGEHPRGEERLRIALGRWPEISRWGCASQLRALACLVEG